MKSSSDAGLTEDVWSLGAAGHAAWATWCGSKRGCPLGEPDIRLSRNSIG